MPRRPPPSRPRASPARADPPATSARRPGRPGTTGSNGTTGAAVARAARRADRTRRTGLVLLAALTVLGLGTWGVAVALDRFGDLAVTGERCRAELDGETWELSPEQSDNAALVVASTVRRGMPARAGTIGIATALQESRLVNIDYGDRDSVGLFQQRPSQGWGTVEQIMDPVYATNAFLDGLAEVEGYEALEITVAAQRVQRSGFPDAYAQHETRARAWASALTGHSPATVSCALRPADGGVSGAEFLARVARDYGTLPGTLDESGVVALDGTGLPGGADDPGRLGWSVAQWAVAVAATQGVEAVTVADLTWTRQADAWADSGTDALAAGQVRVTLAPV